MGLGTSSPLGTGRGDTNRRPVLWPIRIALGFAGLVMAAMGPLSAAAAEARAPSVTVNQDILNNLDWAAAASARVGAETRALAAGRTNPKPAPGSPPTSRLLVQPQRAVPPTPPTRKPAALAESPEEPAPTGAEAAPTVGQELAEAGSEAPAPNAEPVVEPVPAPKSTAAGSDAPPATPAPPEPRDTTAVADGSGAAPIPPQPQPALPESVLVAEAPSPPRPKVAAESEAAAESEPTTTQTAVRMPPELVVGDVRLLFPEGSVDLSETAKDKLAALAQQLQQNREAKRRIQLLAFASSAATNASLARRLSLARALAVRTFLIEKGIRSRRIDVRALGAKSGKGPPDRVDILDARS